jgi:phosphopantothenoylcysteine decarboxylase/phosphopantothenate--cysteine ligase
MRILVTCGPALEPIDAVRRITNFSTGELGTTLAERLAAAGHHVTCLRGEAATWAARPAGCVMSSFATNADLAGRLVEEAQSGETVEAFFHTAALCDYEVASVETEEGVRLRDAKIPSRTGGLVVRLRPALKLISRLRDLFPKARIAGWKYELDGTQEDVVVKGERQLRENGIDLCVLNGRAYGEGFGLLDKSGELGHVGDREALYSALLGWLGNGAARLL